MPLKIIGEVNELGRPQEFHGGVEKNEVNKNAKGGTELMQDGLQQRLPKGLLNEFQIIASRLRGIDPERKSILWLHDLAEDPEVKHLSDPRSRERFAKLVFVSHWQFTTYNKVLGIPYGESIVLKNAIEPIPSHAKPTDGPIRLIYHTTPHRGLDILLAVYEKLSDKWKDQIHLDVYSSFKIYGQDQRDTQYEKLFDICRLHPHITYHGTVSNAEIRLALQEAHIFAYPSTWPETSCIAGIEALSAQCIMVCPSLAALPETTGGFALMYPFNEDKQQHANMFYNVLNAAISEVHDEDMKTKLLLQKMTIDTFYEWDLRAQEWQGLLRSLLEE